MSQIKILLTINTMDQVREIFQLFNRISRKYDLVNHVLSFGLDVFWRWKACNKLCEYNGDKKVDRFLDVATGTGEIIRLCSKRFKCKFIGLDPAISMLKIAKENLEDAVLLNGTAEKIPLKNNSVDLIFVAFGIRNMEDRMKAFSEFHRVLKKGKYLAVLEFIHREDGGLFYHLSHLYIQKILPYLGGMITGDFKAYKYLASSIDSFISADMLHKEIESCGFKVKYVENLFPTVSIIIGRNEKD
ncbi:ubiquinone/menaquinone biosynthesis methyltransferase [Persephonella sp.]